MHSTGNSTQYPVMTYIEIESKKEWGNFLVAQWLRPHTPNAGGPQVRSLVRELDPISSD